MKNSDIDWWKVAGGTTILIGMISVYEYILVDDVFNAFFAGGFQLGIGLWLWRESKNALYVMWFLILMGLAATIAGYETEIYDRINPFVIGVLNLANIISLVMLSIKVGKQPKR